MLPNQRPSRLTHRRSPQFPPSLKDLPGEFPAMVTHLKIHAWIEDTRGRLRRRWPWSWSSISDPLVHVAQSGQASISRDRSADHVHLYVESATKSACLKSPVLDDRKGRGRG